MVGVTLLGTLLASMLLAHARLNIQASQAELRMQGCRIADGLLARWWADQPSFPREAGGPVEGQPGWSWLTQTLPPAPSQDRPAVLPKADRVRLSVFAPGPPAHRPAAQVEVLLNREESKKQNGPDAD